MAKFFADWRNPVLVLGIIGTILFAWLWQAKPTSHENLTVVSVGEDPITVAQVNAELNSHYGNSTVVKMVEAKLLEKMAADEDISVTEKDIDQLMRFQSDLREVQGGDLLEELKNNGISLATYRKDLRTQALQIKMLVTPEEIKEAIVEMAKNPNTEYTLPTRYRIRIFTYADEATANIAHGKLASNSEDSVSEAAAISMDAGKALKIQLYSPELSQGNELITKIVKSLKPGQASQPFTIPGQEKSGMRGLIQLVEVKKAMKPTLENTGIVAGQYLLQNNQQVALRARDLEAKAISSYDVNFVSESYDAAQKLFREKRKRNQDIPGLSSPGATTPGATVAPMAPAGPPSTSGE